MHSSTSMAMRLRNIIVVGFIRTSPSERVGNSSGKPPALQTPRLTASATWRRWALQVVISDQELAMPTTGRPSKTTSLKPSLLVHDRWTKPSMSVRPNQLWLRRWRLAMVHASLGRAECVGEEPVEALRVLEHRVVADAIHDRGLELRGVAP